MTPMITNGNFDAVTAFTPIAVTAESDTDVFAAVGHGLLDGQEVYLYGLTGGTGISAGIFYVVNKNANDFQLSLIRGGAAKTFTTDITAGYVVRTGAGVPTGWTIVKSGSSELVAVNDPSLSPSDMPVGTFAEIRVDATPSSVIMHEHITLVPGMRYRLSLESYWTHEDPAETVPSHAPLLGLIEDGNGHSLLSTGLWQGDQNAAIPIPVPTAKGGRMAIVFTAPDTHTAYTLAIDKGSMAGTAGYLEIVRISKVRLELVVCPYVHGFPENDDTARAALPQNSFSSF